MRGGILELEGISGFSMTKNPNCDVCEMQMASMYCEADEAYLCEECDASVHGANTLASRHKRVHIIEGEQQIEYETEDGVCPAHPFPTFSTESTALKALDFPLGGIRIGDITYARVSHENSSMGRNILDMEMNIPNSNEEEEAHQVPRFVPVAQELPSIEPFRFHALAGSGGTPAKSMRFISLLEGEPDPDDQAEPDNVAVKEHQELGVVPELSTSSKVAGTTTPVTPKGPKADKEREARVNRYREKRRTRMFSKKIRYEVRKIYAENRPRLKGRFVRRTNEMDSLQFMT